MHIKYFIVLKIIIEFLFYYLFEYDLFVAKSFDYAIRFAYCI